LGSQILPIVRQALCIRNERNQRSLFSKQILNQSGNQSREGLAQRQPFPNQDFYSQGIAPALLQQAAQKPGQYFFGD
jgi:hypothetical protein